MGFQEGIMSNYKRILSIIAAAALAFTACGGAASGKAVKETDHQPSIYIKAVEGITDDAIRGMDLSATGSMFDSFDALNEGLDTPQFGYRDYDGNLLDRQGFFDFLAANGVNYARLRVWNDPKDSQGRYYGGGNNDLDRAIELGTYATKAGMRVMIDFHYSDFWADPAKQMEPKAWEGKEPAEKASLLSDFTTESLTALIDAGVDVGIVQIGNETNGMIAGVKGGGNWRENMNLLFDAGCDAVHAVAAEKKKDILAAVHFTNPEDSDRYMGYAEKLADFDSEGDGEKEGVSYDIFASSYYPYWHGSLENLSDVLGKIADKYGKKVMVAETSYAWTLVDADGGGNTVSEGSNDKGDNLLWPFTVQGQANEFRDMMATVTGIKDANGETAGLGVVWWEGAWIACQNVYDSEGNYHEEIHANNQKLWEEYGSGWAASYGGEYDPKDAGQYYGGCVIDNQGFFDNDGNPLESLSVFRPSLLKNGNEVENVMDSYKMSDVVLQVGNAGGAEALGKATVLYADGSTSESDIDWDAADLEKLDAALADNEGAGEYEMHGTLAGQPDSPVTIKVMINPSNLVENGDFEQGQSSWEIDDPQGAAKFNNEDPHAGELGFHFWQTSDYEITLKKTLTVEKDGNYDAYYYMQGENASTYLELVINGESQTSNTVKGGGWLAWDTPEIRGLSLKAGDTVEYIIHVTGAASGWGTIDDAFFSLK